MNPDRLPPIPKELVDALDDAFPPKVPETHWNDREVWANAGQRRVVEYLRTAYEDQMQHTQLTHRGP